MATITPYIRSRDARAQARFYTEALGGRILSLTAAREIGAAGDPDKVAHMSLEAGGAPLYLCELSYGPMGQGSDVDLALEFATEAEAEAAFPRLADGGQILHPLGRAPWGALFGEIADRFGVHWLVTTTPAARA